MMQTGPTNLITDIAGLAVGNADDASLCSGVTCLLCDPPATASVAIQGGAPGTRDIALLAPDQTVETVNGLVLSGGSAFGLDAPGGVQSHLAERGIGFPVGPAIVPIVPGAILFDLLNGGDKAWGHTPPYRALGRAAAENAATDFGLGGAGAGSGATLADGPGGLGSASCVLENGVTIGALVAVNAVGSATMGGRYFAAAFERDGEFGGFGLPEATASDLWPPAMKGAADPGANTTIGIIATDAALTKAQCQRLAVMAHDGFARALWPSHLPTDGDLIFAVSTGARPMKDALVDMSLIGAAASATMARAIARGVHETRRLTA
ncbi:MAG: P1 family peptidase [Pseudomonadota bacterium]